MKPQSKCLKQIFTASIMSLCLALPQAYAGEHIVIDDFSHSNTTVAGFERQYMNDTLAGGSTVTEQVITEGVLQVTGDIVPPRGQPGWASSVIPLSPMGVPFDASAYEGIKLKVRVNQGNLTISANSTDITNFDYHAAPVIVSTDGKFHEVKVPFTDMKRAWSEQTALNTHTINSLSIVAYSLQKARFKFELDEVSFY
ncbi:hypothetical protein D210916BOD24_35230 [Alteromonas sp. D210916BOD_24]|uniref:CIA30 family protein n=1 Tax=Alteromonas sp. D210916BOD_24 TaxID=3157618 RepID=UPI00399C5929